jgi:hypothetical protein
MPARSSKLGVRTVTLVVDLLFKQGVKEAKSFSSMQTAHGGPVCFRSIAVTSDSEEIVKKGRKIQLFCTSDPNRFACCSRPDTILAPRGSQGAGTGHGAVW